jgi:hypothetical protein
MEADCSPDVLFAWVEDLRRYPAWLRLVTRVETDGGPTERPAWNVDLRGRLGPLTRSKRLRMARTDWHAGRRVVFEREELDDRAHSAWVLQAEVDGVADGSTLVMRLHYGGGLWGPVLERLLGDEISRATARLAELAAHGPP